MLWRWQTLSWMNPVDFNASTLANKKNLYHLQHPGKSVPTTKLSSSLTADCAVM